MSGAGSAQLKGCTTLFVVVDPALLSGWLLHRHCIAAVQFNCRQLTHATTLWLKVAVTVEWSGNYYLGKVLSARGEYSEGLRHFQRAYDIQPPFKDEVLRALWQCKKELWLSNQPASDTYQLVLQSLDLQLEHALAQCSTEAERNKMSDSYAAHREVVQRKLAPTEQEMPQHLCCQITWSILVDPVTTPSGISYERRALLEHLERGNKFEPVTREPLSAEDLYPNKMLADAVEAFCDEHPKVFFANI